MDSESHPHLEFFGRAKDAAVREVFINTFIIVILTMAGVVITCSISAYSFARMKWRDRDLMFALLLSSMMLPYAVTLIPSFIGWSKSGLTNTFVPLIAPA
nr:hypothetical protein [Paenibacillus glycanilyticus]